MSWDIELQDAVTGAVLTLDKPHHMNGGTYAVGGTTEATLNVTYNYGKVLHALWGDDGIEVIHGMYGANSIPLLRKAIESLGDDVHSDYWQPTEGNVKHALISLMALASMRPDGVWSVEA